MSYHINNNNINNQSMNNYLNGGYTRPTPMTQQQDDIFSQVFNTPTTTPVMINDWFSQSNSTSTYFDKQQDTNAFGDLLQLLPISPPLTASPVSSVYGNDVNVSTEALVALFPDILNTNNSSPKPVVANRPLAPVAQKSTTIASKPAPVAIMPKTAVIPIAPRPCNFTPITSSTSNTNNTLTGIKRKDSQGESDEVAQKRQKNTDAARRSRLKKIIKMEALEKQVTELEGDNSRLTTRVAVLESEKSALIAKDKGLEDRIRVLEAQLAEAHRALTSKSQ